MFMWHWKNAVFYRTYKNQRFKIGNFNLEDDYCLSASIKFDDGELEELFNENPIQTQKELIERLEITR